MSGIISDSAKKEMLANLARLGGGITNEDSVIFEGNKITLPAGSNLRQMAAFLIAKDKEDEKITEFSRSFKYLPWDGAVCMWNALRKNFGSVIHGGVTHETMFGTMEEPPRLIEVPVGVNETIQVPWGCMYIPVLNNVTFTTDEYEDPEYGPCFVISASGPRKLSAEINGIFQLVEEELATNSIYRGGAFDGQVMPKFVDLSGVDPKQMVYSEKTWRELEASIFGPIRYPEVLSDAGVPIKRAVLLHGSYGTGKTSTAKLIAQEAVDNGWTFIYARPGKDDLREVLLRGRLYQKCVIFFEDLDTISDPNSMEDSVTSLLDMFDGFESKGTEILAILTTNHPETIHAGMLRPGRLDAMIELEAPDADAITRLVQLRIPESMLDTHIDWNAVAESMSDYLPAFVAEASERAIRYAVVRTGGELENVKLETEDLVAAANGLRPQWTLQQDAPEVTPADSLGAAFERSVVEGIITAENLRHS